MRLPETRYVANSALAYQALGMGSFDLVFVPGFVSNLELQWEDPGFVQFARRLSAFARLIVIDKRGTGLSDRHVPGDRAPLNLAADDLLAVMHAAGSSRIALLGAFDGALIAQHFAGLYPDRVRGLALYAPAGPASAAALLRLVEKSWGRGRSAQLLAPEQTNDPRFGAWWARLERLSASPAEAVALLRRTQDLGSRPPEQIPLMLACRTGDALVPMTQSRTLAEAMPGTRFVELAGRDHLIWSGDVNAVCDAIEEFFTGAAPVPIASRALAALLFARIVNPERVMLRLGESRWLDRLERFSTGSGETIVRHSGYHDTGGTTEVRGRFDSPVAAVRAAVALKDLSRDLDLPVAIGLNVGEVEKDQQISAGLAFFVAEEIARHAEPGEVLATRVIADLCGSLGQSFFDHEPLQAEGVAGPLHVVTIGGLPMAPREKLNREPDLAALSVREREVVKLVAEGLSNGAIASQLRLSEHTVKRHVANILLKLNLPTRAAAAALADKLPV